MDVSAGTAAVAVIACLAGAIFFRQRARRNAIPESLIPRPMIDDRVEYNGSGSYEARPGNAMWCQDSALDYFDHGVKIQPGMTAVDCGANVGLFAMELMKRLKNNAKVYCFEPIPSTYALLRLNMARYPSDCQPIVFNCGLSDKAGFVTFQFCPETNIISTSHPDSDPQLELETLVDFIRSPEAPEVYIKNFPAFFPPALLPRFIVRLVVKNHLDKMAVREEVVCELRTLGEVIQSHSIGDIDLLKVDVEGAEELLLHGLADDQWGKIKATVIEIHNIENRLERIQALCKQHGLDQQRVSQEPTFENVEFTFRGKDGEKQKPGHMATLTAARYKLEA